MKVLISKLYSVRIIALARCKKLANVRSIRKTKLQR